MEIPDKVEQRAPELQFDKEISIATAPSRQSVRWKNKSIKISDFVFRLSKTLRTDETSNEYFAMPKGDQDEIKDVGAFVGASLKAGRRRKKDVINRTLITLDLDYAEPGIIEKIKKTIKSCHSVYSTHKFTSKHPRLRLLIWPDRPMTVDEYQAVSRRMADKVGIEAMDDTSYESNRLFYYPSTSSDGEYVFYHHDGAFLPIDKVLAAYGDEDAWKNGANWPRSSRETKSFERLLKKQADPLGKSGAVGAFCRVVPIIEAIEEHLGDIYRKEKKGRYTYIEGSSTNGLVVYDDRFAFSNHDSDPCSGQLVNAFDLLRLHKFGHLDDKGVRVGTPTHKLPSYREMVEWSRSIPEVHLELVNNKIDIDAGEFDVFDNDDEPSEDWKLRLQVKETGEIKPTLYNSLLIVRYDEKINTLMRFNELSQVQESCATGDDWSDGDAIDVREYVGGVYGVDFPERKIEDAITSQALKRYYHPIRDYLGDLVWDGVKRVETVFIDYFGCEDNKYVREVAQCWFTAGVYRVFEPGYKFDTSLVIAGEQGIGKTSFLREIGKVEWYGELSSFEDKEAVEQTLGKWIIEISEMSATNKHDQEQQKTFLSACHTRTRLSYDRRAKDYKRQCIFSGSTNQDQYLKDSTGGRRWWPLDATIGEVDLVKLRGEVDQLWAEAVRLYMADHPTLLTLEAREIATGEQENKREADIWDGVINEWLPTQALEDRYGTKLGSTENETTGILEHREFICIQEIWEDCLDNNRITKPSRLDQNRIAAILNKNPDWTKYVSRDGKGKGDRKRFGVRFGSQRAWVTDIPF